MKTPLVQNTLALIRKLSLSDRLLAGAFVILSIVVIIIGLDSVSGLITGITAAIILIITLTRRWQRARSFLYLAGGSLLGAIFLSGLYQEVALPLAIRIGGQGALNSTGWLIYHNIISYGILLVVPGCIAVGLAGAAYKGFISLRDHLRRVAQSTPADDRPASHGV